MLTIFLKLLRASLVSWLDIACPCHFLSTAPLTLQSSKVLNCPGLAARFFGVALTVSCITLVSVLSVFFFFFTQLLQPGARGCWCWRFHFTPVRWPLFFQAPKRFRLGGAGALAGLPWIPPPLARALPGSTNFVGTNAQAHLLVMSLNVAKCNLGKVNLEAMLVSSFPSYTRSGPMPLAGAPRDLHTQLLACSSSQSVVAIACCLCAILCFGLLPSLPPS